MGSETTSPSLLRRVRDPADRAAWREFDSKYGELIVRYCRGRGLQHVDADDIRQIVMARLSRALRGFRYSPQRGRFRTYLGRIVRNELIRAGSRPSVAHTGVDIDEAANRAAAAPDVTDDLWERQWVHHHLRLAMRQIRRDYEPRSIEMFERLLAGETVPQVAVSFGTTTQAVHKVKQRMRDRLKSLVAEQIRQEDEPDGQSTPERPGPGRP
jgi:RNA polymerase sigma factor (sigma-70 family)